MAHLLKSIFGTSANEESLGNRFRQGRMVFFNELISDLPRPLKILDVGGSQTFWVNAGYHTQADVEITILNLEKSSTDYEHFKSVAGDATNLSQFTENEFDIAFSNSVIEHLHTWENQIKMASEICRVGKKHFVQTPNKYFIIEPHYLLPFFQFLPKNLQYIILTKTPLSRMHRWHHDLARRYVDEILLISKDQMKKLFPQSKLWSEKIIGTSKSFVAHNF